MRNNGTISVIVPIYKVEKYIDDCIRSLTCQTYPNLQILLADDGSPDQCGAICDRYAAADSRILVLHLKNGGAAAARNAALRAATGEYIAFVDGDDYLEPDAFANLVQTLEATGADVVQSSFRNTYADGTAIPHPVHAPRVYSAEEYLALFTEDWTCAIACDKLFRHHVLEGVFYEEGHLIDDEFFTYKCIMNARKVAYIPTVTYNYRQRASSVMQDAAGLERRYLDMLDALEKRREDICGRFPGLKSLFENHYADHLLYRAYSEQTTVHTIRQIQKRLLAYIAAGKVLPWRKGQRKLFLRILALLIQPARGICRKQKENTKHCEYKFFE